MARASFAAGCFWDVEARFRRLPGVLATAAGFAGGQTANPSYDAVCAGGTGHAETVLIEYDPATIDYGELLETFWDLLGAGTPAARGQYRAVIFVHDEDQAAVAREARQARRATVAIEPFGDFWPAEDEHQQYYEKQAGGRLKMP